MTAAVGVSRRTGRPALFGALALLLAMVLGLGQVLQADLTRHAREGHAGEIWNGAMARQVIARGGCRSLEAYWSDLQATFLVLCQLGENREGMWGGVFLRPRRENPADLVVVTAYATTRGRWEKLIRRDGYRPIPLLPAGWGRDFPSAPA